MFYFRPFLWLRRLFGKNAPEPVRFAEPSRCFAEPAPSYPSQAQDGSGQELLREQPMPLESQVFQRSEEVLRTLEQRAFEAVNQQRRLHGVPELVWSEEIANAARAHSYNMITRRFFSHNDPVYGDLANRLRMAGINFGACGENIFQAKGYEDAVLTAIHGWMRSRGHRRNILNPAFTHTGIGIAVSPDGAHYFTQIFARFP